MSSLLLLIVEKFQKSLRKVKSSTRPAYRGIYCMVNRVTEMIIIGTQKNANEDTKPIFFLANNDKWYALIWVCNFLLISTCTYFSEWNVSMHAYQIEKRNWVNHLVKKKHIDRCYPARKNNTAGNLYF